MKTKHIIIAIVAAGAVVYIARRKASTSAPAAQSTAISAVTGAVGGAVDGIRLWFANPPGVPSGDTAFETPHGTAATETDFINGYQADGIGQAPNAPRNYSDAAVAGVGPFSLYAVA